MGKITQKNESCVVSLLLGSMKIVVENLIIQMEMKKNILNMLGSYGL